VLVESFYCAEESTIGMFYCVLINHSVLLSFMVFLTVLTHLDLLLFIFSIKYYKTREDEKIINDWKWEE